MSHQEEQEKPNGDAFDLEIEAEPNTDAIMREAVEAVEAVESNRRDDDDDYEPEAGDQGEGDELADESDSAAAADPGQSASVLGVKLKEAQERTVRALADYENFRRRVDRERVDYARYASEVALSEFLPVVDNLNRALDADGDAKDLKQGVEMIQRQMLDVLSRLKVVVVPSVGERFDPSVHEAVAKEESDEVEHATVIEQYQTGYLLHDRLLRPAMVRVAMPPERDRSSDADSDPVDTEDLSAAETDQETDA